MSPLAALLENASTAALTILSLALFLVALRAWWHTRSPRVALLAAGFGLFLAKGILLSVGLFRFPEWGQALILPSVLIDLGILALFYLAAFRRGPA